MAFNIMDLFSPAATNRLIQPAQSAAGVQNFLANPQAAAQQPQVDPWEGLRQANVDPMTTAAAPAPQQPAQAKAGGFLPSIDREMLQDMFLGMAMGQTPQQSLALGAAQAAKGKRGRADINQTVEWLKGRGMDEGQARMVASSPETLQQYLTQMVTPQDPMKALQLEKAQLEVENLRNPQTGPSDLGLNPQFGVDAQGNPVLLQLGKDGNVVQSQMPEGVSLSKEPIRLDAGTHFVLLDPITRQPVGQIPKENQQEAADKARGGELGKQQGEAIAGLPAAIKNAEYATSVIDQAINHPGREIFTGASSTWDPRNYLRGTDAADYEALHKQIEGQTFLEAFESLKGAGQITEVEGQKATQAKARLDRAQSDEAYLAALKELKEVINIGLERARAKAGQPATTTAPPPATTGAPSVDDLLRKYGG